MKPSASIIITNYNQAATLEFLFLSLQNQVEKNFEVVVADDGSSDSSSDLCKRSWGFDIQFITQPDDGYRKALILNKAIPFARSDYFIFLDADVILEKHFVYDHLNLRLPGHFVCGRRVEMGPEFSKTISGESVSRGAFDKLNFGLLKSCLKKDSEHFNRSRRVSNGILRTIFKYNKPIDILGSNFSCWKKDLMDVNGFNESLESYWGEDGDLYIRLRNRGLKAIGAKALCVQYHVFHKRRTPTPEHVERYYRMLQDFNYKWAEKGLQK
jgi:glycosyltransferase involved in cell wall biosynthesis